MQPHLAPLGALLTALLCASPCPGTETRPNIILILADDLGAKELGCYGNKEHNTPNLDRMAAEGTRFETFYANPLCTPTRVALMTGQYGFHNGFLGMQDPAFKPAPQSPQSQIGNQFTHADLLKSRGYTTALAGKWQLSGELPTLIRDAGFDEYRMWAYDNNLPPGVKHPAHEGGGNACRYWHPSIVENANHLATTPDQYGPDLFNEFVIDFAGRHRDAPFFVYYTSVLTHSPHLETPDPASPGKRWPATFKSNLEYLDHLMGRLFASLRSKGIDEHTLVIFLGDNGTGGSGKGTITELGARVPCIVRGPGVKRGVVSRAVADITDLMPTLAEFSGAQLPTDRTFDGRSLLPVLRGESQKHRDWIYSHLDDGRVLRDSRWLLEIGRGGKHERFFDCGERRDGTGYKDVTDSTEPEVRTARAHFAAILATLPEPKPRAEIGPMTRKNPLVKQRLVHEDVDRAHPVYATNFESADALRDWKLEGGARMAVEDGHLVLESRHGTSEPGEPLNHLVCWLAKETPADFLLEFRVRPQNRHEGLNIVFFNARGLNGESVFDPALKPRSGLFAQYHSGDLNNYHISYWAGDRGTANVRKNRGFALVATGPDLVVDAPADAWQTIRIHKRDGTIRLTVDHIVSVAYDDDGVAHGLIWRHPGWIGLRQMSHTIRCEYDDLRVYPLTPRTRPAGE